MEFSLSWKTYAELFSFLFVLVLHPSSKPKFIIPGIWPRYHYMHYFTGCYCGCSVEWISACSPWDNIANWTATVGLLSLSLSSYTNSSLSQFEWKGEKEPFDNHLSRIFMDCFVLSSKLGWPSVQNKGENFYLSVDYWSEGTH